MLDEPPLIARTEAGADAMSLKRYTLTTHCDEEWHEGFPSADGPGAEERYTVRVPTEGAVATTHAVLEIPADVTVLEVLPAEGTTFQTAKQDDRITAITWKR